MSNTKNIVKEYLNSNKDVVEEILMDSYYYKEYTSLEGLPFSFKCVDSYGGEGCGDNFYTVIQIQDDEEEIFVKLQGWYSSYNGVEYESWKFVQPKQKTITVYE